MHHHPKEEAPQRPYKIIRNIGEEPPRPKTTSKLPDIKNTRNLDEYNGKLRSIKVM